MSKLIYAMSISLDGYFVDESGKFDWSMPDEEVHSFINDLERGVELQLLGHRFYDVLKVWEKLFEDQSLPSYIHDYASIWNAARKIVYSKILRTPETERTEIRSSFDVQEILRLKESTRTHISIGGAELAAQALTAGLVDEVHFFVSPVIVGGGRRALPEGLKLDLELMAQRTFTSGSTYLGYRVKNAL
ncbi:deaminase [Arthrobacter sp. MYb227]|uniref:dihydrofolate reductase family protein n=1 Tax=Arthrobacter sp. MYb227 TaxID=1848601 RepID=UPI000CFC9853|nr:dihydrofolate reductase family protein [Arthrobacter sp. MYb227]PQZ86707.1 deaminase [Arthrobacter sp. MYb227]